MQIQLRIHRTTCSKHILNFSILHSCIQWTYHCSNFSCLYVFRFFYLFWLSSFFLYRYTRNTIHDTRYTIHDTRSTKILCINKSTLLPPLKNKINLCHKPPMCRSAVLILEFLTIKPPYFVRARYAID